MIGTVLFLWTENVFTVVGFVGAVATVGAAALGVALALGAPTAAAAHHHLRRVQRQWIHVAVFALLGVVVAVLTIALMFPRAWPFGVAVLIVGATACACASGRLAAGRYRGRLTIPA